MVFPWIFYLDVMRHLPAATDAASKAVPIYSVGESGIPQAQEYTNFAEIAL